MDHVSLVEIINRWQAMVVVGIILVPQILTWLASRSTSRTLKHEVTANSGATLKDSLNRIEMRQKEHGVILDAHTGSLDGMESRVASLERDRPRRDRSWFAR